MSNEKLVLITGNEHKLREFERLLNTDLEKQKLELPEIQSTDVREVTRYKAQEAYKELGKPCFVDDTGLTIKAWGNLPGALIKWFIDNVGNEGILRMLSSTQDRSATVTTALGYCDEHGVQIFVGELQGSISYEPLGDNGFGYDAIFVPENQPKTFAEMSDAEKDSISMRSLAAQALKEALFPAS